MSVDRAELAYYLFRAHYRTSVERCGDVRIRRWHRPAGVAGRWVGGPIGRVRRPRHGAAGEFAAGVGAGEHAEPTGEAGTDRSWAEGAATAQVAADKDGVNRPVGSGAGSRRRGPAGRCLPCRPTHRRRPERRRAVRPARTARHRPSRSGPTPGSRPAAILVCASLSDRRILRACAGGGCRSGWQPWRRRPMRTRSVGSGMPRRTTFSTPPTMSIESGWARACSTSTAWTRGGDLPTASRPMLIEFLRAQRGRFVVPDSHYQEPG